MTQVVSQESKSKSNERKIEKALAISKTKRVRRSGQFIFVQSGNPRTPKVFYCVQWSEFLQCFVCDCPDFTYNCMPGDLCVHILAGAFKQEVDTQKQVGGRN
jgi:hypothetical protein